MQTAERTTGIAIFRMWRSIRRERDRMGLLVVQRDADGDDPRSATVRAGRSPDAGPENAGSVIRRPGEVARLTRARERFWQPRHSPSQLPRLLVWYSPMSHETAWPSNSGIHAGSVATDPLRDGRGTTLHILRQTPGNDERYQRTELTETRQDVRFATWFALDGRMYIRPSTPTTRLWSCLSSAIRLVSGGRGAGGHHVAFLSPGLELPSRDWRAGWTCRRSFSRSRKGISADPAETDSPRHITCGSPCLPDPVLRCTGADLAAVRRGLFLVTNRPVILADSARQSGGHPVEPSFPTRRPKPPQRKNEFTGIGTAVALVESRTPRVLQPQAAGARQQTVSNILM